MSGWCHENRPGANMNTLSMLCACIDDSRCIDNWVRDMLCSSNDASHAKRGRLMRQRRHIQLFLDWLPFTACVTCWDPFCRTDGKNV